ncbi:pilus assembly protein PilM [Candidatus Saccharibacteria bacterium]|nr:pilus assembly protein PilM [Candidatus Saccharibacteria bacterium]
MSIIKAKKKLQKPTPPPDDVLLSLDIGTEFVKAVIARENKDGSLDIIGVGRTHQDASNMHAGAIADIGAVVSTCERALSDAEKQAGVTCKLVSVGIAGELVKGNTTTVHYRRKNGNKPLSEQEMSLIIKRVQDKAGELARREVALETNNPDIEVRLINSAIVSLVIDGYKVSNPIGFKGSDLTIQFYTAFAPLVHISAIEKVCAELSLDLLAVAVEPFAVCRACLGDDPDSNLSAIVMDIGGGTTDIAIVDDGGVDGTKMFGIGGRSFTHQIAEAIGVDYETAEYFKLNPDSKDLPEQAREKMNEAIEKNLAVWLSGAQLALEDFKLLEVLPQQVLLCGGGAGLVELQETLATSDWYQDLPFSRRPIIHLVDSEDIPGINNETDIELDHSFITALGLLRVSLDTLAGSPDGHRIRDRIAKVLQN